MKQRLSLVFILFLGISVQAQSILWKVSGKKIKSPSYLYGSIHIQDKRVFAFDQIVLDAFMSTEAFAMEILIDEVTPQEIKEAMFMKNNTIEEFLTPEQYKILDSIVKAKTGIGMLMYNKMKPFFLSSQIMQLNLKKEMDDALDLYFLKYARKEGKTVYKVEKFAHQVAAIDKISLKEQVEMLYKGLTDTTISSDEKKFEELLQAYLNFDLNKLFELSNDTSLPKNFNKAFLIDRNKVMAKNFIKIAKKQTLFCVIGAAHLPGENGVINLLRKKGLSVEPVIFNWIEVNQ
jgi:uncharacterized protein YbaP (TraB family)